MDKLLQVIEREVLPLHCMFWFGVTSRGAQGSPQTLIWSPLPWEVTLPCDKVKTTAWSTRALSGSWGGE